ncbi:CVNH domain-containing protein [Chamaesiphon sp.]|uniref:mannose-binding lectin n=1 Tax=Chamaesiphon sp. TaxID=2814140 RepID=UPI0035930E70
MSYFPKLDRLSSSLILITCGAILAAIPNPAVADSTSPSNYQNSCRNIQVDGADLSARCRRVNGGSKRTSIPIRGIENRNGNLAYLSDATDSSNYQNSCRNIQVSSTFLSARCRRVNGGSNLTSIRIRGIENRNGNLNYLR